MNWLLFLGFVFSQPQLTTMSEAYFVGPFEKAPVIGDVDWLELKTDWQPEIPPMIQHVQSGDQIDTGGKLLTWQKTDAMVLKEAGIYWVLTCLWNERACKVELEMKGADAVQLYVDGDLEPVSPSPQGHCATLPLPRGTYRLAIRLTSNSDQPNAFSLTAKGEKGLAFRVDEKIRPARFSRMREIATAGNLAISKKGRYYARKRTRYDRQNQKRSSAAACFDHQGNLIAANLPGSPLGFAGEKLLLRGKKGRVLLYDVKSGETAQILKGETGFKLLEINKKGNLLLFSSSKGVHIKAPKAEHRHIHSRQTVTDYQVNQVLWLLDLRTGYRRQLTAVGDYVLDSACFSHNQANVFYTVSVPMQPRPWFKGQLHSVDLKTGQDDILGEYHTGWEVRLCDLAALPDGKTLLMTGPPGETGAGKPERNVYNRQLLAFDLKERRFKRISSPESGSFNASHANGFPQVVADRVFALMDVGSTAKLVELMPGEPYWSEKHYDTEGKTIQAAAISADGNYLYYKASSQSKPAFLALANLQSGSTQVVENINSDLEANWKTVKPVDVSVQHEKGHTIEAWAYIPDTPDQKIPLVLYYYGGASPTDSVFNGTHQFFAANGYAVLVVNPRGAYGFGDSYADCHAGDWGSASSQDILFVLDAFLEKTPQVDSERVGIYGGSYGGFMTEYLVSITDRFAAAVSLFGISDLSSYWGEGVWGWTYGDMALGGKTPMFDEDYMVERSPLFRAEHIHTPLLLLHGEADLNVRPEESMQLFTALKMLNRPVEMVLFPGEDHGISGTFENREKHRTMILEWFDKYLKGHDEAWQRRWR
ncbi:MAG: hypothetical protein CSA81_02740 [Acidobacteria bacterium]|nr:MAG: hypothetical protein CSA81_02740 [Acidobacteriota bacterium]